MDRSKFFLLLSVFFLLGCIRVGMISSDELRAQFEAEQQESIECSFIGTVMWMEPTEEGYRIQIEHGTPVKKFLVYYQGELPKIGDEIQGEGTYFLFSEATNPGQFSAREYYDHLGISMGYQMSSYQVRSPSKFPLKQYLWEFRQKLCEIAKTYGEEEDYGIFTAITFGEKQEIEENRRSQYQEMGIIHILAISGMHISLLGHGLYRLIRRLSGSMTVGAVLASMVMLGYLFMTGGAVSAVRAVIVFFFMVAAPCSGRLFHMTSACSMSALLLLFKTPGLVYTSGFQFSFACLFGLGEIWPAIEKNYSELPGYFKKVFPAVCVQCTLLPFILYHYYQISPYSIIINCFVIPLTVVLISSAFTGMFVGLFAGGFAIGFFGPGHYILKVYDAICAIAEDLPFGRIITGRPELWRIYVYFSIIIVVYFRLLILFEKRKKIPEEKEKSRSIKDYMKILGLFFVILLGGIIFLHAPGAKGLEVAFLDVGQGDGCLIRVESGEKYLVDGGSTTKTSVGKKVILPACKYYGVGHLDGVFLSHGDVDHVNGVIEMINDSSVKIDRLFLPQMEEEMEEFGEVIESANKHGVAIERISMGMKSENRSGSVQWACLWPEAGTSLSGNDASLVMKFSYHQLDILFMGDLSSNYESDIMYSGDVDVLKVGHHGSKYSSNVSFLRQIQPEAAVISCGRKNQYGHPALDTLERLDKENVLVFQTRFGGAILLTSDGSHLDIQNFCLQESSD